GDGRDVSDRGVMVLHGGRGSRRPVRGEHRRRGGGRRRGRVLADPGDRADGGDVGGCGAERGRRRGRAAGPTRVRLGSDSGTTPVRLGYLSRTYPVRVRYVPESPGGGGVPR